MPIKNLSQYLFRLVCFLFWFFLWPYILNGRAFSTEQLIFSVLPSKYFAIYAEKYALYQANFGHVSEVFQGLFFAFLLQRKDVLGSRLQEKACIFIKKETLRQVCSCEFCEIYNNTFFTEHLQTTASAFLMVYLESFFEF